MQRRRRSLEDRPGRYREMPAAPRAGPRPSPALLGLISLERHMLALALRAISVFAIVGELLQPEVIEAGIVIREPLHELHERVVRVRGLGAFGISSVNGRHANHYTQMGYT